LRSILFAYQYHLPYPVDKNPFWKLVALGGELRRFHLLEGAEFEKIEADPVPVAKVSVEKVKYSEGTVYLSDDFCFEDVPLLDSEFFIGGYQPAQKWLKDRKGCILKGGRSSALPEDCFCFDGNCSDYGGD
jgi:hypothetical protein